MVSQLKIMVKKEKLLTALRTTSDGQLEGGNLYDDFILGTIDNHTNRYTTTVNMEEVYSDISYMISELHKVQKILNSFKK